MTHLHRRTQNFSLVKRAKSLVHAGRGLYVFAKTTHNAWIHFVALIAVLIMGVFFHITRIEWVMVILASGLVLTAEAFNTSIEFDIDLTSPEYHPYARDTKDVAAAAVLIASVTAGLIGVLVFFPYILASVRM